MEIPFSNPFDDSRDEETYAQLEQFMQPYYEDPTKAMPFGFGSVMPRAQAFQTLGKALNTDEAWLQHTIQEMFKQVKGRKELNQLLQILDDFFSSNQYKGNKLFRPSRPGGWEFE